MCIKKGKEIGFNIYYSQRINISREISDAVDEVLQIWQLYYTT